MDSCILCRLDIKRVHCELDGPTDVEQNETDCCYFTGASVLLWCRILKKSNLWGIIILIVDGRRILMERFNLPENIKRTAEIENIFPYFICKICVEE